jgi:endonuclease/exonuclease/phosphatase family metal-dependent hydrolase
MRTRRFRFLLILFLTILTGFLPPTFRAQPGEAFRDLKLVRHQEPIFLDYNELRQLSEDPFSAWKMRSKLTQLFTTPILSNEAALQGVQPKRPKDPRIGPFLRVVSWNIEQARELDQILLALTDPERFAQRIDTNLYPPGSPEYLEILAQRALLDEVDILILQEVDIGVKRSGYRNSVKEIAEALKMNYAYAVSYLEVDPVNLGTEVFYTDTGAVDESLAELLRVDPKRYRGALGQAVLSRYPIFNVESSLLKNQPYDWYAGEKESLSALEKTKRLTAKEVFFERLMREVKVGGRILLRVDLHVPELPEERLSVINIHLEVKGPPKKREKQMAEILGRIRTIQNPVIMAGDFNSTAGDVSPTSFRKEVKNLARNPTFWLSRALRYAPQGAVIEPFRFTSNITKNFQNPTTWHVPLIAPNPQRKMFRMIEEMLFADTFVFDFRGDPERSANGRKGVLANSNERDKKGFKTSARWERSILGLVGKLKLDWIFVKAYLSNPRDREGSYRFAPHFGRTLEELNDRLKVRMSDHHPIVVDLPFEEPELSA